MSQIKQKCQAAFAAWLKGQVAYIPAVANCYVAAALTEEEFRLPAYIVRATKAEELSPGTNVYLVDVVFCAASAPDDDALLTPDDDGTTLHSQRTRILYQLLFDLETNDPVAQTAAVVAALNKPVEGPDLREVQDFTCSGYIMTEEADGRTGRHVEDSFTIQATCSYGDPD